MTPQQENHLSQTIKAATDLIETKYRAGQQEHGGNLFDLSTTDLLDEALMEVTDLFVYLLTVKNKLIEIKKRYGINERNSTRLP